MSQYTLGQRKRTSNRLNAINLRANAQNGTLISADSRTLGLQPAVPVAKSSQPQLRADKIINQGELSTMPLDCPSCSEKSNEPPAAHPSSATAMATAAHNAPRALVSRAPSRAPARTRVASDVAAAMACHGEQPAADRLGHARLVDADRAS